MRFVPTHCITTGMKLGENLYNERGDLMLSRNEIITQDYMASIQRLQYNGLYIDDEISNDLEVINLINNEVKIETIKIIKNTFIQCEQKNKRKNNGIIKKDMKLLRMQIENIVDEIFNKKELMVNMVDMKVFDDYTYYHSVNVAVLSIVMGISLGMDRKDLNSLGLSALLHDMGKVFIQKQILNKPGKLSDDEFQEMKKHSQLGYEYIKSSFGIANIVYMGILDHHERYDGTGYPNNIKGCRISIFGRIIAVADVYDALTSDRPYRKGMLPSEAIEYIMGSVATAFDPEIVETFVRKIAPYPIGTCVKLSNGLEGIVMENYEEYSMRPKIRIFADNGKKLDEPYELLLFEKTYLNITVVDII
ncbi:MAG: HD-GYP domain-containing protein [Eubacteriales bacterium]|nr:HD-GYP domain-containing protein [Eubacteriales bacterium]MDD4390105.1 HD-GYP domain-containing protein [Eubacteriales bacterium]